MLGSLRLVAQAETVILDGQIHAYSDKTKNGKNAGKLVIDALKIAGEGEIILKGEKGKSGTKGQRGSLGKNGRPGSRGRRGGHGGSVKISFWEDQSNWEINVSGGVGGDGGLGGEGGPGGYRHSKLQLPFKIDKIFPRLDWLTKLFQPVFIAPVFADDPEPDVRPIYRSPGKVGPRGPRGPSGSKGELIWTKKSSMVLLTDEELAKQ